MKSQARTLRSSAAEPAILPPVATRPLATATRPRSEASGGPDLLGVAVSIGVPLIALAILTVLANDRLNDMESRLSSRVRDAEYRIDDLRRENLRLKQQSDKALDGIGTKLDQLTTAASGVDTRLAGVEKRLQRQRVAADRQPAASQ